jgi:hypothetical protein
MESNISANTLFHFTSSLESLKSILKNGLFVRYSLENYTGLFSEKTEIAIPMVCFCDIPLSQIKRHTKTYGKFAIGLSKAWGKNHRINPVIYTYPDSAIAENLGDLKKDISAFFDISYRSDSEPKPELEPQPDIDKSGLSKEVLDYLEWSEKNHVKSYEKVGRFSNSLSHFIKYVKPYEGKLYRDGKYLDKIVRFYEEREWRFCPSKDFFNNIKVKDSYDPEVYNHPFKRRAINIKLAGHIKLTFEPDDIRFIIVDKDDQIPKMLEEIEKVFGDKISSNKLKLLGTRLISLEQIVEDL